MPGSNFKSWALRTKVEERNIPLYMRTTDLAARRTDHVPQDLKGERYMFDKNHGRSYITPNGGVAQLVRASES